MRFMGSGNLQCRTRIGAMNRRRLHLIRPVSQCGTGHLLPRGAAERVYAVGGSGSRTSRSIVRFMENFF